MPCSCCGEARPCGMVALQCHAEVSRRQRAGRRALGMREFQVIDPSGNRVRVGQGIEAD
ncbi:MAG: hypothetical protein ABIS47_04155 [Acidimicrobiales bacterium]